MDSSLLSVGNVVKLKELYVESSSIGMIIEIQVSEFTGEGGWISMDYMIMLASGCIVHVSESCIEKIIN